MSDFGLKNLISFSKLPWKSIATITVLITLFGGMFAIDNRFAKSSQLESLSVTVSKDRTAAIKLAEVQTIKTFQGFQMQQMMMNKGLQLQILNIQKESIEKEYWDLKRRVRDNPNDRELKEDFNDVKIQRQLIKEKIDKIILKE